MSGWLWPDDRRATSEAADIAVAVRAVHLSIGYDNSRHLHITYDHFLVRFVHIYPHGTDKKMALAHRNDAAAAHPSQGAMPMTRASGGRSGGTTRCSGPLSGPD